MTTFIRNRWYAAAWSAEVGRTLFVRTLLGEPVLLYRTAAGSPVALRDMCPHRLLPLSKGTLKGDAVECGYHGITFDCSGACVRIPGQSQIPLTAKVTAYPVTEKFDLVWIWMGDPGRARVEDIIDIPQYGQPGWAVSRGPHTHFRSNYQNITDNLVDPAHTSFVHRRTIGSAAAEDVPVKTEQQDDTVVVSRWVTDGEPVPLVQRFGSFRGRVDRWQYYYLYPPCTSFVDFGAIDAGVERTEANRNAGFRILSYAMLTPETECSTHYFWFQVRNFHPDSAEVTAELVRLYAQTFEEDRVILEEIQRVEDRVGEVDRLRVGIDNASIRLRRIVQKQLAAERAAGQVESVHA